MEINNHFQALATVSPTKESRYPLNSKLSRTQAKSERKAEDRISKPLFILFSIFSRFSL
jgi:hypothetical protein